MSATNAFITELRKQDVPLNEVITQLQSNFRITKADAEMKIASQKMRVNIMATGAGLDKTLFESISLCISAINGCSFCVKAHSNLLLDNKMNKEYVLNIGRISSVISAISKALSLR